MQNNPKSAENIASASNGQKTTQERQANFLSLTNLENQIPKPLFNQMVNHVSLDKVFDLSTIFIFDR